MKFCLKVFFGACLISLNTSLFAAAPVVLTSAQESYSIGDKVEILTDASSTLQVEDILSANEFQSASQSVPNLQISKSTFWVRFTVQNNSADENFLLNLAYPIIDSLWFYSPAGNNQFEVEESGESVAITSRKYHNQNFIFDLYIPRGSEQTYLIKIRSGEQIMLPLTIGTPKAILQANSSLDLYNGIYFGIVIVMLLYNLFIYFSVRDKSYLLYVIYILFVGLVQASDSGYAYRMLWPGSPGVANFMVSLFPALVGISSVSFLRNFLNTRLYIPKADKFFFLFIGIYTVCVGIFAAGFHQISYQITLVNALSVSIFMLATAYRIMKKGYRPAKFFLMAWSVFLMSVCLFVMKDLGVIPYNALTKHILQIGSAIELVLLSFALADRINILKKEKEDSQVRTMEALRENERIVREQNVILEAKVNERTSELQKSNSDLNTALVDLKEAQAQLVDAEKMASLGQLTAGIAHEINNPINFVVSNINPLKRDIQDLLDVLEKYDSIKDEKEFSVKAKDIKDFKEQLDLNYVMEEINMLLKGIDDGANRTAEIVKSLRTFSRLDESDLKKADINDGLDSTLLLLNSSLNENISVVKKYDNLDPIECYAGKLNQVFMNLLKNAIHAVCKKKYASNEKPTLTLVTENAHNEILVKIKDNGTGMDEVTMNRIFEPFFTTKDVGEGTGLGLSIVYNIIEKHDGTIDVESEPGVGTEFTIAIPKVQVKRDVTQKDKQKAMKADRRSRLVKNLKLSNN